MTKALLEWETIDAEQIEDIMCGRAPRPPKPSPPPVPPAASSGGSPDVPVAATTEPAKEA